MTDAEPHTARTTRSARRTAALLLAWLAAAVVAGIPSGARAANTTPRASKVPIVVNTGPECFAGHAPAAASNTGN